MFGATLPMAPGRRHRSSSLHLAVVCILFIGRVCLFVFGLIACMGIDFILASIFSIQGGVVCILDTISIDSLQQRCIVALSLLSFLAVICVLFFNSSSVWPTGVLDQLYFSTS